MPDTLTFVLPNGVTAIVPLSDAKSIADRLWNAALQPGAPTAAARIIEALRGPSALHNPLRFEEREATALLGLASESIAWNPTAESSDGGTRFADA